MSDCCSPGGHCSHTMDTKMTEEFTARFEELSALEHEFEDVEEEISKSQLHCHNTNRARSAKGAECALTQPVFAIACAPCGL